MSKCRYECPYVWREDITILEVLMAVFSSLVSLYFLKYKLQTKMKFFLSELYYAKNRNNLKKEYSQKNACHNHHSIMWTKLCKCMSWSACVHRMAKSRMFSSGDIHCNFLLKTSPNCRFNSILQLTIIYTMMNLVELSFRRKRSGLWRFPIWT